MNGFADRHQVSYKLIVKNIPICICCSFSSITLSSRGCRNLVKAQNPPPLKDQWALGTQCPGLNCIKKKNRKLISWLLHDVFTIWMLADILSWNRIRKKKESIQNHVSWRCMCSRCMYTCKGSHKENSSQKPTTLSKAEPEVAPSEPPHHLFQNLQNLVPWQACPGLLWGRGVTSCCYLTSHFVPLLSVLFWFWK